jgi:hypothetical protein
VASLFVPARGFGLLGAGNVTWCPRKGKPVARRGRKATDLPCEVAGLPKGGSTASFLLPHAFQGKALSQKGAPGRRQHPEANIHRNGDAL